MRTCKTCKVNKEYNFFMLRENGRKIHKDETGHLWNGRQCGNCFTVYVRSVAGKEALADIVCAKCAKPFRQKNIKQRFCNKECYKMGRATDSVDAFPPIFIKATK